METAQVLFGAQWVFESLVVMLIALETGVGIRADHKVNSSEELLSPLHVLQYP